MRLLQRCDNVFADTINPAEMLYMGQCCSEVLLNIRMKVQTNSLISSFLKSVNSQWWMK